MNKYHDEVIGFESILAIETIDLLHIHKTSANDQFICESIPCPLLDEHELAMVV